MPDCAVSDQGSRKGWLARYGNIGFLVMTAGSLAALVSFLILLIYSLTTIVDWEILLETVRSKEILYSIRLTLITATLSTFFAVIFAIPASYAVSRMQFFGKSIVDTILDLPIVLSPIALGAALLIFFNTPLGSGVESRSIRFVFEVPGIVLAQFVVVTALAVRLMKTTYDGISPRYETVARTLGCNRWQAFFKITLPLAKNGLISSAILAWARAVGEFGATVTLAGATRMKTETLPVAIYLSLSSADVERAVAVILVLITISLVTLVFLRKVGERNFPL
jgi:molybdate transport system permease protein